MKPTFSLVVLNGSAPGTTLRLESTSATYSIGRHASRELALDDQRASRLHARIVHRAHHWHLEDCGSLNGTYVNSQPVQQTVLEPGDLIRIADRLILYVKNSEDLDGAGLNTSLLKSTTMLGKLPVADQRGALVEQSLNDSMSRVVRDSAVLCRLANQLHQHIDTEALVRVAVDALVDGIAADAVALWLVGADGRLRCAGRWGKSPQDVNAHVLASLAVEQNKAFLIREPSEPDEPSADRTISDDPGMVGTAMGVPIPGQKGCRGAIECYRSADRELFTRNALDFTIVVAHQAGLALENLEHRERLEQANEELRRRLSSQKRLVGSSNAMRQVLEQIGRVGPTASTVLVLGESGTGKELVAHAIHDLSHKRNGPYVAVNCAAFSENLLESELFGHETGAFTGADRRRVGQFERAHRGTIFLDEVGEMSLACQAKLLRLLEGHPFERLGGQESIHVDVRVISATHRDLQELIRQERFREDLYYRLRVIDLCIPPLRERGDDILEMAAMFLDQYRRSTGRGPRQLSDEAIQLLRQHHWPGNVRELKNAMERSVVLGGGDQVMPADMGLPISATDVGQPKAMCSLREAEQRHIEFVLRRLDGNKTKACRVLGIGRGTLYNKLEEFNSDGVPDAAE